MAAAALADSTEGGLDQARRNCSHRLHRRGQWLEILTTAWNTLETAVTVTLGLLAHSLALVAFGLDSLIEVFASLVVLWHLEDPALPGRNRRALRLVAAAFLVLGVYLLGAGVNGLVSQAQARPSLPGIAFLGTTAVVMVTLSRAKRDVGLAAGSEPLVANANMTLLDGILATAVLVALALDATGGWWWADPAAALLVSGLALREGADGLAGTR